MPGDRVWVIAENDGEAREIRKLLEGAGERLLVSGQGWGARWEWLEPNIVEELRKFRGCVYGVELAGPNAFGAVDIDHHRYAGEDRWRPESALEQVAAVLGVKLNRWQQLVALNDRGYIPAMLDYGATAEEVEAVRVQDRAAQGVTAAQETAAARDVALAVPREGRIELWCPEGFSSAHTDLLHGRAAELLLGGPHQWCYYGHRAREFSARQWQENHWAGGSRDNGFFCIATPGPDAVEEIRGRFWQTPGAAG